MNHALITGGAGFIGSHLSEALLQEGWAVTAVDNFDPFYCKSVKTRNIARAREYRDYRFVEVDIRDMPSLQERLAEDYGIVVHLAAKAGVRQRRPERLGSRFRRSTCNGPYA